MVVEGSTVADFMGVGFMEDSMMGTMVDSSAEFFLVLAQDFGRDITEAIGEFR